MNLRGWLGTCALVLVAASGCKKLGGGSKKDDTGSNATASGSGTGATTETGPIKIGHYASMTGSEATFGVSTDQAIQLAVEERNAAGGVKGRKIQLVTLDTASKASEGGTVVTRLINDEHVTAVLGEVASSITLAGGRVAQQLGVPDISPSSTNVHVTEIGDMVSRVCFTDDFQAWVVAKFVHDQLKVTKAAIMYDQGQAYSKGLADFFTKSFTEMGGTITTSQAYSGGNPDVSAQLQTIKGSGAQAVFMPGYYGDAANYMKQAKSKGIKIPFIGGDGWDSPELFRIAGDAATGNYFSNHYSHEEQRPEVQSFVAAYQKKWGTVPDGLAALGYDAARVLFDAMDRAGSLDGKTLAAAINSTKDFKGVTGLITIDAKRNAQKKAVVLKIDGGAAHLVTDIWPPGVEPPKDATPPPAGGSGSATAGSATGSAAMQGGSGARPDDMIEGDKKADTAAPTKKAEKASAGGGTKADPDEGGE